MSFRVIVTVGPSTMKPGVLKEVAGYRNIIYRLNGAHTPIDKLKQVVDSIKKYDQRAVVLLDLPGNKIRFRCTNAITLSEGMKFWIRASDVTDPTFFRNIRKGDMIYAQDSTLSFEVIMRRNDSALMLSYCNGVLSDNKGLHKKRITKGMRFVSERDAELVNRAHAAGIDALGISYVRYGDDIDEIKGILAKRYKPALFVKIETDLAISNLDPIISRADNFIIDRGDLASEIGLENIPLVQDMIIGKLKISRKNVFLATQFLKNMVTNPIPSIAEVNDLAHVLSEKIDGIQLADETAIGNFPVRCLELITSMKVKYFGKGNRTYAYYTKN